MSVEGWLEIYIIDQVDSNFTKPLGLIKDLSDKKHMGRDYPVLERVRSFADWCPPDAVL